MLKPLLFILVAFYIHNSSCIIYDLYDAGKSVWHLYLVLDKMGNSTNTQEPEEIFAFGRVKNRGIKIQMDEIFMKLDEIEKSMKFTKINDSLELSSSAFLLHTCVIELEQSINDIDYIYNEFRKYMKGEYHNTQHELEELMRRISTDIQGCITWIRNRVIGENVPLLNHKNIIDAISAEAIYQRDKLCDGQQPISSILARLFRMVVIAEIRTNFMLSLADIQLYGEHGGWNEMNVVAENKFKHNFASYVAVFASALNATDELYFRACNPVNDIWIRDKDFYELEKTIQTTISPYNEKQCHFASCSDVQSTGSQECMRRAYNQRISCLHTITNCSDLGTIETCVLRNGPYRFQYMKSSKVGTIGQNFECSRDNGDVIEYGSACACDCYGDDNKISLAMMKSRTSLNWVIIGLRFVRHNGILHIQPREGKLEANGYISPDDQQWIPIPDYPDFQVIDKDNRLFFLNDLILPSDHALTGVKFIKTKRRNLTGFAIKIFGTPFEYKSGSCLPRQPFEVSMKSPNNITGSRIEFQRVPPTHAHVRYTPNSATPEYVILEKSELTADFGQSTLPFFDAVPVLPNLPSVLGGIGIFYKNANAHAGVITLRVFGIRYNTYLLAFQRKAIENGRALFNSSEHH